MGIVDDFSEISILNEFEYDYALINAIEINLNDNFYLLNCTNGFTIWFYDYNKNEIKNKKIIPKKYNINNKDDDNNDYENFITYKNVFYIEKRNLLIVQLSYPNQSIIFYNIHNENNEFNIVFQSQININKEIEVCFSRHQINSCIIQDKYLLIGTKIKKNKKINIFDKIGDNNNLNSINNNIIEEKKNIKIAGIYIINLDNKKSQIENIENCSSLNKIIPFNENMIVCNYESLFSKSKVYYTLSFHHFLNYNQNLKKLSTFFVEDKNEKIILHKKKYINGHYKNVNSDIINLDFLLCSSESQNCLLKINKDGRIINYFNKIYIK